VKDNSDGTYTVEYTPTEDGPHKVDVKYDGDSIPGTPKDVNVLPKTDTGKVKAYGPGLESALTGQKAQFTVDTKEAGTVIKSLDCASYFALFHVVQKERQKDCRVLNT
jgi:filamin